MSIAGLQTPATLFNELVGNAFKFAPEQIGETCEKKGVTFGCTTTVDAVDISEQLFELVTVTV